MNIGNLVARITADVSNFKAGISTAQKSVKTLGSSVKGASTAVNGSFQSMAGKATQLGGAIRGASSGVTGFVSTLATTAPHIAVIVAVIAVLVIGIKKLSEVLKQGTKDFQSYEIAMLGVLSAGAAFGESQEDIKNTVNRLAIETGLAYDTIATGLKNLLASGLDLEQATEIFEAFVNIAALGKRDFLTLDQAVLNLTSSYKAQLSMLSEAAGMTENYDLIIDIGAGIMGKRTSALTDLEKAEAKRLGVLEIATWREGDMARYLETTAGKLFLLNAQYRKNSIMIGELWNPITKQAIELKMAWARVVTNILIPALKGLASVVYVVIWAINLMVKATKWLFDVVVGLGVSLLTLSLKPLSAAWKKGLGDMKTHFKNFGADLIAIEKGTMIAVDKEQAKMFDAEVARQKRLAEELVETLDEINEKYAESAEKRAKSFEESLDALIWAHLDKRDALLKQLEEENEDFEESMAERQYDFDESIQEMKDAHEEKVADIKEQIADENEDYEENMADRTED